MKPLKAALQSIEKAVDGIIADRYYPILLTRQMHTDYTVSAHDILIFEKCSVGFVICM